MAGPVMVTHGSEALLDRLLRPTFIGEVAWCQLFSEPGAVRTWPACPPGPSATATSGSSPGRRSGTPWPTRPTAGMLVARTDPDAPKHKGLTYFALDMHAAGVEVRPLRQLTGEAEFNEVYLTEVRVPDGDRIGDVGDGWRVAMTTLMNERTTIGGGGGASGEGSGAIAEAVRIWREEAIDHHPATRDRLVRLWSEAEVLRLTNVRAAQNRKAGNPGPGGFHRQADVRRGQPARSTNCASTCSARPVWSITTTR